MSRAKAAYPQAQEGLHSRWVRLHRGDREAWPDERHIERLARKHVAFASDVAASGGSAALARGLQEAWRDFHAGDFPAAIRRGAALGVLGASVANKAAGVWAPHSKRHDALKTLEAAIERGERAVSTMPSYPNAHYMLALVLGRYSQGISILQALARGLAGRVRSHLERTLELEPLHAEAHIALGLYHAEIVNKIGAVAGGLSYGASAKAAVEHLRRALELSPDSPVALLEYGNGLLLLDPAAHHDEARALYEKAATREPADAMQQLDIETAEAKLASLRD